MNKSNLVSILTGSAIIIFGVAILLNLFVRLIDTELLLVWWPAAFLLAGFVLISSSQTKAILIGVSMLLAAAVAVAERTGIVTGDFRIIIILTALLLMSIAIIAPTSTLKKPGV